MDRINEIERILNDEVSERVREDILNEQAVIDAAERLLKEELKDGAVSVWPTGKGFVINLIGVGLECEYDPEIKALYTNGLGLDILLDVKKSLQFHLDQIEKVIETEI